MKHFVQNNRNVVYAAMGLLGVVILLAVIFSALPVQYYGVWTDSLVFFLVGVIILFAAYTSGHEHLRSPWRHVRGSKLGMMAVVVLMFYVIIGLLDSVHYQEALETKSDTGEIQYSGEVMSVFDHIMRPISEKVEKTYSAPFATHAYVKESIEKPDGTQVRDFPRLKHGGSHLKNPEQEFVWDIIDNVIIALILTAFIWAVHAFVIVLLEAGRAKVCMPSALKRILQGETETPWHVILATLFVLFLLLILSVRLGTQYHIFGTDKVGQDVFYQTLKSIRTGLVIGTLTTLIMLPFAVLFGIMAGYFRGWVDDVITYVYTTLNSIPGILLIAAAVLLLQVYMSQNEAAFTSILDRTDLRLLFLCIILGITSWTGLCRMLRGETLKLREMDYIQSAVSMGVGKMSIISRHILPNVMHIVLIAVVLDFSGLVLAEAVLSYVGIGVDPGMNSWGNMINQARFEMAREPMVWWSLLAAFIFMFALVLAANLFSDAVRDAFDPRLRDRS